MSPVVVSASRTQSFISPTAHLNNISAMKKDKNTHFNVKNMTSTKLLKNISVTLDNDFANINIAEKVEKENNI
jgi:hypothetical protein